MNKFIMIIMILLSIIIYNMDHTKPVYKEDDFKIVFAIKNKNKNKNKKNRRKFL